ncbi:hypothetical protein HK102_009851 [Quaeritorhiza haematococci]|nr:hypothetical protein HK102_009851 [Quaeritorhiza haematococci]
MTAAAASGGSNIKPSGAPASVVSSLEQSVGNTALFRLPLTNVEVNPTQELFAKLEFRNPSGSIHDRFAAHALSALRASTGFEKTTTLVVATSGSLALSLATLAAGRFRIIAILPENTHLEKIPLLSALRVEIVRTPPNAHPLGPESPSSVAKKIAEQTETAFLVDLEGSALEKACDEFLAELSQQLDSVDAVLVSSDVGNAALETLRRCAKKKFTAVEVESISISANVKKDPSQSLRVVPQRDAYLTARHLISSCGLMCGVSSGAVTHAAYAYLKEHPQHKRVVAVLDDGAQMFASSLLNDDWLIENEINPYSHHQIQYRGASIEDLQLPEAVCVQETASVAEAMDLMISHDFSQLPVINARRKMVGFVTLGNLESHLKSGADAADPISKWMYAFNRRKAEFRIITPSTPLADLESFFAQHSSIFVTDETGKFPLAVVTKWDVLRFSSKRREFSETFVGSLA